MSNSNVNIRDNLKVYLLSAAIFFVKLSLLPFSQTDHADAVSRILSAANWIKDPKWINHGVWAPFHFYINGFGIWLHDNVVYTPKIINILFSVLTLIPFYFLTKREFNKNGAFIATLFLATCPILFRNSFLGLSETPYLFFLTLSLNLLSLGIKKISITHIFLSGLAITLASGIRYEAWIIILIMGIPISFKQHWKLLGIFTFTSLFFPIYWLLSNWLLTGNPLHSIGGTYHWNLNIMANNDNLDLESYLRRIWFFPFSWLIAIGIPSSLVILRIFSKILSNQKKYKNLFLLSIPFWIVFAFFQYNAFRGQLLLQHRYIGTLVVLSLPFVAVFFRQIDAKKKKFIWIFPTLTILLSFLYNTNNISPLPRLDNQSAVHVKDLIKEHTSKQSSLVLDFIDWEYTYYIALHSYHTGADITIIQGARNSTIPWKNIESEIRHGDGGVIMLKKGSSLYKKFINIQQLHSFDKIYEKDKVVVFKWG